MKKIKYILSIIGSLLFLSSCSDDFLNLAPISSMSESTFYKTQSDYLNAVNGAYSTLYSIYAPDNKVLAFTELMSDNCTIYHVSNDEASVIQLRDYSVLSNNGAVSGSWNSYYNALFIVNTVLSKLPNSPFSAEAEKEYEAEMRFLRAIYYFDMVRFWGDVPLVLKPVTVSESYSFGRTPATDVYAQIVTDLLFAEENLLSKTQLARIGQASKCAAQGMLGKVYATMGDVENAKTYLKKVIDSPDYSLLPSFYQIWSLSKKNSSESLFEIQYKRGLGTGSRYWQAYLPAGKIAYGGGFNQVTDNLWNEFEATDARRDSSINQGYTDAGKWVAIKFPRKWTDTNAFAVQSTYYGDNNFIVLRLADIYLLYSEITQDPTYLNLIRKRAGLAEWGNAGYPIATYPTLPLAIEHERRVELALEYQRWFDLKRTNRAIEVLTAAKGKVIKNTQLLLPIPQTAVDQNPDVLIQNEGY